jgi:hypothetical protein
MDSGTLEALQTAREVFQSFHKYWYLGVAIALFLIVQVIRGKIKFGDFQVKVPWLTDKFNGLPKEAKTWILIGSFAVIGAFASIGIVDEVTLWSLLDGGAAGIILYFQTNGARNAIKQGIDGIKSISKKRKEDNNGS